MSPEFPATNASGTVVWTMSQTPFGIASVDEDPDGNGITVTNNFRFPGQYYDAETGLNYNYFRSYDPATGRYTQSDPIGLRGGMNTFGYVFNNPVMGFDPFGLKCWTVWNDPLERVMKDAKPKIRYEDRKLRVYFSGNEGYWQRDLHWRKPWFQYKMLKYRTGTQYCDEKCGKISSAFDYEELGTYWGKETEGEWYTLHSPREWVSSPGFKPDDLPNGDNHPPFPTPIPTWAPL